VSWFPLALLTAFATATGDMLLKARFSHLSPVEMAVVRSTAPVPFLLPVLILVPWPHTDPVFWKTLSILVPLEILALLLYMQALKVSPLSLSIPFLAFTPVFIVLTGWILLGEGVSRAGLAGILLTVTGAYALHLKTGRKGVFAPFRAVAREQGSRLMLVVAAIYSITSVLGKQAIQHSEPIFFACFYFLLLGCITPPVLYGFRALNGAAPKTDRPLSGQWQAWCALGLIQATMVLSHMWAIHLVAAAYMIAVKRTSLVFSVLYGKFAFGEEEITRRLAGASLMALGVGLILLGE